MTRFSNGGFVTPIWSSGNHTSVRVAGGATPTLSRTVSVYGEIGRASAGGGDTRVKSPVQGAVGVRVRW